METDERIKYLNMRQPLAISNTKVRDDEELFSLPMATERSVFSKKSKSMQQMAGVGSTGPINHTDSIFSAPNQQNQQSVGKAKFVREVNSAYFNPPQKNQMKFNSQNEVGGRQVPAVIPVNNSNIKVVPRKNSTIIQQRQLTMAKQNVANRLKNERQ